MNNCSTNADADEIKKEKFALRFSFAIEMKPPLGVCI
jgi:hypothetical protein